MRVTRRRLFLVACGLLVAVVVGVLAVPQLRWRAQVVFLQQTGRIPGIALDELAMYLAPGSEQNIPLLIETRNPYTVIRNRRTGRAHAEAGKERFERLCASCHGPGGTGTGTAPTLVNRQFTHGVSDWAVYRTIRRGVPGTGMPAHADLADSDIWQLVSYIRSLDVPTDAATLALNEGRALAATVRVPASELDTLTRPGRDWLMYSGAYNGTRHSRLSQINSRNVHQLAVRWIHHFRNEPRIEATPVVRSGVMYLTIPFCSVHALDAHSGRQLWNWSCNILNQAPAEDLGGVNRGVAILNDKVFATSWDARLFALSAATGEELWQAAVEPDNATYYISGAPLAFRDLVVTGISTRRVGRASITAFDANTGKQRWKFMAVPGPGEPGHETWAGDSWERGGGPTWITGSYDPTEDLLYWGVGNPKPDYDRHARAGDNLYTNSVVALRGSTGQLAWHFQFVPADDRDWGANQVPVLVDRPDGAGGISKRLLWANRNGLYYQFDRVSGKFLQATPFVQVTWTEGLDANGRPTVQADADRPATGRLSYPGVTGGTHWWSPTYDPRRNLMIVPVLEQGMVFFPPTASAFPTSSGMSFYTAIRALDASTGKLVWEHRRPPRYVNPSMAGTLSTDGDVVFGSDLSTFFALDADTGKLLWSIETGGMIIAAPVTYEVNGEQFVTLAAGSNLLTFSLPPAR